MAFDWNDLGSRLVPTPGRPDLRALRRIVEGWIVEATLTRSQLEERALWLFEKHGLPRPLVNHPIGRWVVDFYWPEWRLVVEVDGYAHHSDVETFGKDRQKDRGLQAMGLKVARFTWTEVTKQGAAVVDEVQALA